MNSRLPIILGMGGASGADYGLRLLEYLLQHDWPVQLLLSDLHLPDGSGLALCQELQATASRPPLISDRWRRTQFISWMLAPEASRARFKACLSASVRPGAGNGNKADRDVSLCAQEDLCINETLLFKHLSQRNGAMGQRIHHECFVAVT